MLSYHSYEQISNLAPHKAPKAAYVLLEEGWTRRNYPTLDLNKPIPWALSDPSLRSWNFYIHSLDMIDALLSAHSQTGESKFLVSALRVGLDWLQKHPRHAEDISPMAWYDMAVGLRAYRLGYLYQAADHAGLLDAAQKSALWASLENHRAELAEDANIAFHNNHGYFQVAGQLALGRRFKDISHPMAALCAQGVHRLKRMLDQQFGPDGVHREHSPDYHRMVADTLLGLVRAGLVEDPDLLARVDGVENALAWFVTPEGTITNFGDSDSRKMIYSAEGASRKWTTPLMRAVASNGAAGSGWPRGLRVFDESGYAIVRLPDPDARDDITRDSYLAQTAAFHSRTHKHCDDLSFVWHDRGQPLLVDAGRYGYIGKTETGSDLWQEGFWYSDPMRVFMESTRAHNTLEFDGLNAQRKGVKPYGSALVQACEKNGVYCIETRCKQHRSIWHDRLLMLRPGQWLVVFDVYTDNLKAPHDVRQWFHLAPGHKAVAQADGFDVTLEGGGEMAFRQLLDGSTPGDVISGHDDDPIQGWFSDEERSVTPADALSFGQSGQSTGVFATVLSLSPGARVNAEPGRSNVTGRKAQLGWSDRFGQHRISFDRGNVFALDYDVQPTSFSAHGGKSDRPSYLMKILGDAQIVLDYGASLSAGIISAHSAPRVFCALDPDHEAAALQALAARFPERLHIYRAHAHDDMHADKSAAAAEIWDQPWFKHPDVVAFGGEAALACLTTTQSRITKPVTLVWCAFKQHPRHAQWQETVRNGKMIEDAFVFDIQPLTAAHKRS